MISKSILTPERQRELLNDIQEHLTNDILPFWLPRIADEKNGGYHTDFDRQGRGVGNQKNTWLHARQLWMFSVLYRDLEPKPEYLFLARQGRDWLVKHAPAGDGRWNYLLAENGQVLKGTVSFYTDLFALMGLAAYVQISGEAQDIPLLRATFETANRNLVQDDFKEMFPQAYKPGCIHHGKYMIALNAFACAAPVLGWQACEPGIRYCINRIFKHLVDEPAAAVYELRTIDGRPVDTPEGHRLNPGHTFESMWFALALPEGFLTPHQKQLALQVIEATAKRSLDPLYGGVLHMLEDTGNNSNYVDWNPQRALCWDEKVWWTHCEALVALLVLADQTSSPKAMEQFEALYSWSKSHFYDKAYGEWYAVLTRAGDPRLCDKGGLQKSAFHLPRALYNCCLLLQGKPLF